MTGAPHSGDDAVLLTAAHVAKLLQISPRTLWRLLSAGSIIAPIRLGHSVRWRKDELMGWIANGCPARAQKDNEK